MTGADLAEQLRERRPGLPVVIITGFADPDRLAAAWKGPVLAKPFDAQGLARAIRAAMAQGS
jgi:FixJ family two-component response regulator